MANNQQPPNQDRDPRQAQPGREGHDQGRKDMERPEQDQERIDKNRDPKRPQ